ncbi:MAG: uroporphyrinogen decarboxylase family protein [Candidatus Thorarchaeota archaeon]
MTLSKRERVFKTLELDGEPDKVPIHCFGFEQTGLSFQAFKNSEEWAKNESIVKNKFSNVKYYIREQRFWNVDLWGMDPFGEIKIKIRYRAAPPEYPDCRINIMDGRIYKIVKQVNTGLEYSWYVGGYFKNPEILNSYWDRYGKPTDLINDRINYSPQIWEGFVEAVSPYFYPMANLPINPSEALVGGITFLRFAYYMRKDPDFIHMIMDEYTKVNIEIIKRLDEAGVDIVTFGDDLGYKENQFLSLKNFREFILPYHKRIYQACKKRGILIVLHSCGKIDPFLPDLTDAGLTCIQSLEATAGVDLKGLKETLGDRLCFMGGLDSSGILTYGSPKDVEENVKSCIKNAGKDGGYFVGPSHDILNIPWENILAMRAAIEKYRNYPLNF